MKNPPLAKALFEEFCTRYESRFTEIRDRLVIVDSKVPHEELAQLIMKHRYFLSLSAAEGFGLMPLEAMAAGSTVIGFDGMGGAQYMRDGVNCAIERYPDLDALIVKAHRTLSEEAIAKRMAVEGIETAKDYSFNTFRDRWTQTLTQLLG